MSIKIEVSGNSLAEVADKLLALAGQFQTTPWVEAAPGGDAAPAAEKAKPSRKAKVAEKPAVEPEQEDAGKAQTGEAQSPAEPAPEPEATAPSAGASASEPLDFDKDVAPVVIEAVARVGRESVSSTLAEFGVERASEVDPSQYGELVAALQAL